ncbi:MAG TPA: hypothetical protein VJV05_02280 [Pyrinomonadaceae bacterium]|nr:hypothetical protein [Pyrinomonadaceae bacterium]
MKTVASILMFVLLGVVANAQDPKPEPKVVVTSDAKVVAEIAASSPDKVVKNAPFSAEAISESVQTLSDGNRIVRNSTSKLYRNSEGRFRRESTGGTGGMLGSFYTYGSGITLFDPVGGFRYSIDPNIRTTRQMVLRPQNEIRIVTAPPTPGGQSLQTVIENGKVNGEITTVEGRAVMSHKIKEEIRAAVAQAPAAAARAAVAGQLTAIAPMVSLNGATDTGVFTVASGQNKWETRTEELGTQNIEGVDAEGTRTITTIPAGAIGNERPIEITYEKWYSKELQLVVMSKHNDPRFGEQTYKLTNIFRSEPDPSLFSPPQGYRMISDQSGTYTFSSTAKAAAASQATKASPATTVSKTKP